MDISGAPNFKIVKDIKNRQIVLEEFKPRGNSTLEAIHDVHPDQNIIYYQKPGEKLSVGKIFSLIFYTKEAQFFLREHNLDPNLRVETGSSEFVSEQVKELAISHNEDQLIFPNEMLARFKKNSLLLDKNSLSVQVYHDDKLVGHISAIKAAPEFPIDSEAYCLLRIIVDKNYRQNGGVKDFLIGEFAKFVGPKSAIYLQVFPKNIKAQKFFMSRANLAPYLEKWIIPPDLGDENV